MREPPGVWTPADGLTIENIDQVLLGDLFRNNSGSWWMRVDQKIHGEYWKAISNKMADALLHPPPDQEELAYVRESLGLPEEVEL